MKRKTIFMLLSLCLALIFTACSTKAGNVNSVNITNGNISLSAGLTQKLNTNICSENGKYEEIVWKSDNKSVATVTSSGVVTAVAAGMTYVSVAVDGNISKIKVTVSKAGEKTLYSSENGSFYDIQDWGSDSGALSSEIALDGYSKVYKAVLASKWNLSCLVFANIGDYKSEYDGIRFKIKSSLATVQVKVPEVANTYTIANGTSLGNGWYELTVPFSAFSGVANGNTSIGILGTGGDIYITDVCLYSN